MRIVIDLEAAQTPQSRNRGIGRYSLSLARAMLRRPGDNHISIALNGAHTGTIGSIREALDGLVEPRDIRVWHAALPPRTPRNEGERRALQHVRESFLASLGADFVHVSSVFEFGAHPFPSVGGPHAKHRTAVTLYDLIPHLRRDVYLPDETSRRLYDAQLAQLRKADLWLAISESSRREGVEHLSLPPDRVVSISSAVDAHFTPSAVTPEHEVNLRVHYGLWRPFVMYTGGIDPRKNVEGLIEAWAAVPAELRRQHQLAIVCSVQPQERERLRALVSSLGLESWEVVLTGFVPEADLVDLYRIAKLFVFPSRHEGFGLPALEAMSCGTATIGADNSSIPEVIGRADALFDAESTESITAKIVQCLSDDAFRRELARHGLEHARNFSWDHSAQVALEAMSRIAASTAAPGSSTPSITPDAGKKPTLAFVGPLPPARSGIADYGAELLPALSQYYVIDAIVEQPELDAAVSASVRSVRDAAWFASHAREYDRIVYQFGNSHFHEYMVPLLAAHPGTVVLHDFFLSGMQANRELVTEKQPRWLHALYESHGWRAVTERQNANDMAPVIYSWPANFEVLRDAQGVIVHSHHSKQLAREWYGPNADREWAVIPLLRVPVAQRRAEARRELGISDDEFIVCSFGIMGPSKMSDRIVRAWQNSSLARDPRARLVFVGENDGGEWGRKLSSSIQAHSTRATITGWADREQFRSWLDAADLAVQLRTMSRGETSAAVLDAMNHGLAVIANANGSMARLPADAVWMLPDEFDDADLVAALEALRSDAQRRSALGAAGRHAIESAHSPSACAAQYARAIEGFASAAALDGRQIARDVGTMLAGDDQAPFAEIAAAVAIDLPMRSPAHQLLVDVTEVGAASEIAGTIRGLLMARYPGWRVEPVVRPADGRFRYARRWTQQLLGIPAALPDDLLEVRRCDVWAFAGEEAQAPLPASAIEAGIDTLHLTVDCDVSLVLAAVAQRADRDEAPRCYIDISELLRRDWGSGIQRVVKNDLMELLRRPPAGLIAVPVYTRPGEDGYKEARSWLREKAWLSDGADVADPQVQPRAGDVFFALDLQPHFIAANERWLAKFREAGGRVAFMLYDLLPLQLPDCFSSGAGADHARWLHVVSQSDLVIAISRAVETAYLEWLARERPGMRAPAVHHVHLGADMAAHEPGMSSGPTDAEHELLQQLAQHPSLLMVGTVEPRKAHASVLDAFEVLWSRGSDCMLVIAGRQGWMVDDLAQRLRAHPEAGKRLVWMEEASDAILESLYGACSGLIFASRGEGFGLPLIEAAQRGLPLIARDLPVFREVAGDHAFYFGDDRPEPLANSLDEWLELRARDAHPKAEGMRWLTWAQSAARVRSQLESLYAV